MEKVNQFWRRLISIPIYIYRLTIRPVIRPCCRYYPSCSEYALIAIKRFGIIRGMFLACHRLLRCHPWQPGGIDPVPPNKEKS